MMRISDLIDLLSSMKKEHGNVLVYYKDWLGDDVLPNEPTEVTYHEEEDIQYVLVE